MKKIVTNILNGLIILALCITILILVYIQESSTSIVQRKILDDVEYQYHHKISIKQLDSLSAAYNFRFTESLKALNFEITNSGKNSVLH